MITSKKLLIIGGLICIVATAVGIRLASTSDSDSVESGVRDFARVEDIFARANIDQDVQDFIVQEFYNYSENTEDDEELRDIVELSAVIGFLRASFQGETYTVLSPEFSLDSESSVVVRQYEVGLGDMVYFLNIGIDESQKAKIVYLDDQRTSEEEIKALNSSDVGFEIIENLTLEAANQL